MSNEVSALLRRQVRDRAWSVCEYCLVHEQDVFHGCEVDHVLSIKHGGPTVLENLAFACFHCNRHKGTDLGSVHARSQSLVRFFNPRSDIWTAHFYWNEDRIEPLTEIGDVTARLFEFNHPERIAFRKLLRDIGRTSIVRLSASSASQTETP